MLAHWVTLVQSHVQFLPPPPEVTKWVGCYSLASSFLPRIYPGTLLHPSLPLPDPSHPQLTMFFFLLEFRLVGFPVAQACCSLFLNLQIMFPSIHSTPLSPALPAFCLGLTTPAFLQAVRPSSRTAKGHLCVGHLLITSSLLPATSVIAFLCTVNWTNYSLHILSDWNLFLEVQMGQLDVGKSLFWTILVTRASSSHYFSIDEQF